MRPRYYCEHCGKGSGSGGHMKKHEAACTKNPARGCRMCKLVEQDQPDLNTLMALLPTVEQQKQTHHDENGQPYDIWRDIPAQTVEALREAAGGCPACMMAAIRQRGLLVPTAEGFNFTEECKRVWNDFNEAQLIGERSCYAY